jgi:DNA-binding CsgD family transcriptional regulator
MQELSRALDAFLKGALSPEQTSYDAALQLAATSLLDWGVDYFITVHRISAIDPHIDWSMVDGQHVEPTSGLPSRARELVLRFPPDLHFWIRGRTQVFSAEDLLRQDRISAQRVLDAPMDFGRLPWKDLYYIPIVRGRRWESVVLGTPEKLKKTQKCAITSIVNMYRHLYMPVSIPLAAEDRPCRLTDRQLQCTEWAIKGKTLEDTADILGLSPETISYHLRCARRAYGVENNVQLFVRVAHDFGLGP